MDEGFLTNFSDSILAGQYQIIRFLDLNRRGGVCLCKSLELGGKEVVVKFLHNTESKDTGSVTASAISAFMNEIASCARISHPNVVRIYDYFQQEFVLGYSMEFVEGGDLSSLRRESLCIEEKLRLILEITEGVSAIHSNRVVHRDIKPENILVTPDGKIKITDFGISLRLIKRSWSSASPELAGTVGYMSPEYLEHGTIDERGDIYAIGVVAFELLTGAKPFGHSSVMEIVLAQLKGHIPDVSSLCKGCPKGIDPIIRRTLERKPRFRYQNAGELAWDLRKQVLRGSLSLVRR